MFPDYFTWQVYSRNYLDAYLFFLSDITRWEERGAEQQALIMM